MFYILDGTIYQSPNFLDLVRSKAWQSCTYLSYSYKKLQRVILEMQNNPIIEWDDKKRYKMSNSEVIDENENESLDHVNPTNININSNDNNDSMNHNQKYFIRECPDFHLIIDDVTKYAHSIGYNM